MRGPIVLSLPAELLAQAGACFPWTDLVDREGPVLLSSDWRDNLVELDRWRAAMGGSAVDMPPYGWLPGLLAAGAAGGGDYVATRSGGPAGRSWRRSHLQDWDDRAPLREEWRALFHKFPKPPHQWVGGARRPRHRSPAAMNRLLAKWMAKLVRIFERHVRG